MQQPRSHWPQYDNPSSANFQPSGQLQQNLEFQSLIPYQQGLPVIPQQSWPQSSVMIQKPYSEEECGSGRGELLGLTALQRSLTGTAQSNRNTIAASLQREDGVNDTGGRRYGVNYRAAPGPIPASGPLTVYQDYDGVSWVTFEYSPDRVKLEYTIRCDVESVNTDRLPDDFKFANCVYPRVYSNKSEHQSKRKEYEGECNKIGWALTELNPCLRGKRGLTQRAVDSWRNSQQDARLRSRRVRRLDRDNKRKNLYMNNVQKVVVDTNLLPEQHHHTTDYSKVWMKPVFPEHCYNALSHNYHHGARSDRDS